MTNTVSLNSLTQAEKDAFIDAMIDVMTELQNIETLAREKREALEELSQIFCT